MKKSWKEQQLFEIECYNNLRILISLMHCDDIKVLVVYKIVALEL